MADNLSVEAPDFIKIKKEAGDATADACRLLWFVLNEAIATSRRGIRSAQEKLEPKLQADSPAANQDNYDHFGASVIQFGGGTAFNLTGIKAPEPGKTRIMVIFVTGAGTVTVKNASASSISENRINTNTGADVSLTTGKSMILVYLSSGWRHIV